MVHEPTARLAALAVVQHGVFTRLQARDAGFSLPQVKRRVRAGAWEAVDHGVYRMRATPGSWHQRLLAACLAGPAVASHRAAARLWCLPGLDAAPVEVTAVRHLRRHAVDVIWHESTWLGERDVTTIAAIPTTAASRTVVDLGAVLDSRSLQIVLDDALRRGLVSVGSVLRLVELFGPGRRGVEAARKAVARRMDGRATPESVLETRFDDLVNEASLPKPQRQHVVLDRAGGTTARIDFAYPDVLLAIEIDGARHHAGVDDWRRDLSRQNELLALGWRVLRFTADDLEHRRSWVIRMVRAALAAR